MPQIKPASEKKPEISTELSPTAVPSTSLLERRAARERAGYSSFWIHVVSLLFAFFIIFGRAFAQSNSWDAVFSSPLICLLSLTEGLGWYGLFFWGIRWLFRKLDAAFSGQTHKKRAVPLPQWLKVPAEGYLSLLDRRPGVTAFCTLLLANIPYMILSYPALFMGDIRSQFVQYLGERGFSNHHPITHTLFLSLFFRLGEALGNNNLGIFFCGLTQVALVCGAIAYGISVLAQAGIGCGPRLGFLLYYCLHPRISAYLFLMTKDVPYSAFCLTFYLLLWKGTQEKIALKPYEPALFFAAMAGMILFRNDGKFLVILTLLAAFFLKFQRKKALICLGAACAMVLGLEHVVFPLLHVEEGSIREMLSVPFQQTARFVRDAGDQVTEEEKEIIGRVLDYDALAENYDPDLSDNVKATYHGTKEELKDYFLVWLKMFFRRPGIYFQATMNNYYQYFYPGQRPFNNYSYSWSTTLMERINEEFRLDYHYPAILDAARNSFEALREGVFSLPFLSLLRMPAFYTWGALLAIAYALRRKNRAGLLFCLPMAIHLLIFITGPTNGAYCRYQYPMLLYLPMVLALSAALFREEARQA